MKRALTVAAFAWPSLAAAALFGSVFAGTPPGNLGVRDGRLAACPPSPNCVSSAATDDEHRIAPLAVRGTPAAAFAALVRVVAAQPGATVVEKRPDYLYATFTTPVMGFVDDVEFALLPGRDAIDVRSASRLGYSDLGTNRKRIEAVRAAFVEAGS